MATPSIPPGDHFEKHGASKDLVVLLHAFDASPERLIHLADRARQRLPDADLYIPRLPVSSPFSTTPMAMMVQDLLRTLDGLCPSYDRIQLVGHSLGGLLARKLYVVACGSLEDAPLEAPFEGSPRRAWAGKVERIILLAGMNRGWQISHHLSLRKAIEWRVGIWIGTALAVLGLILLRWRLPMILELRRGSPFITQLRLQWLAMRPSLGGALTVQLLGSIDDIVSPEDNVDLVSGGDFIYLDVPFSGHSNVIEMNATPEGEARAAVFLAALTKSREELEHDAVLPSDFPLPQPDPDVTDVIFVIHGIRDLGHWTQKIARRIRKHGLGPTRKIETETASYGFFPMLPFLFPWCRREKVEWLMDRYTRAKALYPKAQFSFVGHSNGTYLLADALERYPSVRFRHVVFAGSVVRNGYPWSRLLRERKVGAVLNYIATADWVVAGFPKWLGCVGLGAAGHDGFASEHLRDEFQIRYVEGTHDAALKERHWDAIARFIVQGEVDPTHPRVPQQWLGVRVMNFVPVLPLLVLLVLGIPAFFIWWLPFTGWTALAIVGYFWSVYAILTRF